MSPLSKISFKEWETEQLKDLEFVSAINELEPGYQIARLRIRSDLTQAQLAEMAGIREATVAQLESGNRILSLSLVKRIAEAMNARIEIKFIPIDVKGTKE